MINKTHNRLSKQLKSYLNEWVNELEMTNKSKYTLISYKNSINPFIDFIRLKYDILSLYDLRKSFIIEYLDYKNRLLDKQEDLSFLTKRLIITHLKIFFKYIEDNSDKLYDFRNLLDINIRIPIKEPKSISKDDEIKIKKELEKMKTNDDYISIRNVLMIKLLLVLGLRREELRNLKISDFTLEFDNDEEVGYSLKITGKGSKQRILYVKLNDIEFEFESFKEIAISDHICITKNKKLMDGSQIYRMIKSFFKKADIADKEYSVHSFRHTFAVNLLLKGIDISIVQVLLGHSDIKTTTIYTQLRQETIKHIIYNK